MNRKRMGTAAVGLLLAMAITAGCSTGTGTDAPAAPGSTGEASRGN